MGVRLTVLPSALLLTLLGVLGCESPSPPTKSSAKLPSSAAAPAVGGVGPRFVPGQTRDGVEAAVLTELKATPPRRVLVYVGATWCEPCQVFHRAVEAGEVDAALPGVVFVEYDWDRDAHALRAAGYNTQMLPLFALPSADGRASGRQIAGSIAGPGATQNLVPRLERLLRGEPTQ